MTPEIHPEICLICDREYIDVNNIYVIADDCTVK